VFYLLTMPVKVTTPQGSCLARFAHPPKRRGDPWWVIYRDTQGGWFTTMLPTDARYPRLQGGKVGGSAR